MSEVQDQTDTGFYVEKTLPTEVASELLNSARARIFARVDTLEQVDPETAERLAARARELHKVQATLSPRDPGVSEAVIAKWGPLLKDEAAFWTELAPPVAA